MKKALAIAILTVMMAVCSFTMVSKAQAYDSWSALRIVKSPDVSSYYRWLINYTNNTLPDFVVTRVEACMKPRNDGSRYPQNVDIHFNVDIKNIGGNKGLSARPVDYELEASGISMNGISYVPYHNQTITVTFGPYGTTSYDLTHLVHIEVNEEDKAGTESNTDNNNSTWVWFTETQATYVYDGCRDIFQK